MSSLRLLVSKGMNVARTRIKICGITSPEDAEQAVVAGADAIGLVFYEPSPRHVSLQQAAVICERLPAFVTVVALSVNKPAGELRELLERLPIGLLQFHGDESPEQCSQFGVPYLKALRVRPELDIEQEMAHYGDARSILLDAYRKGVPGGTGERFDWQLIPEQCRSKVVLAGGLTPDNVARAIAEVSPYAVDVSGGVERAPGIKDPEKVHAFIQQVTRADRAR